MLPCFLRLFFFCFNLFFQLAKNIRAKYTNCPIPTVTHEFVFLKQHEKEDKLIMLIEKLKTYSGNDPVIIFCKNSKSCRAVDYHLNENGFSAVSLHSELPPLVYPFLLFLSFHLFANSLPLFLPRVKFTCKR